MDLVLQTINGNLHRIADLVSSQSVTEISPHCLRCINVEATDEQALAHLKQLAYQEQVDVFVSTSSKKLTDFKLLVMDMDSTLITIECIDEIADMHGTKPQVAAITEAAMRGEIDFAESLNRRVALLKGLPEHALQQVYDERLKLSPGAEKLLHAVQSAGLKTLLVSGGFTFFTDRIKTALNLDYSHSNQLEIIDGKLTGRVVGDIMDAQKKRRTVEQTSAKLGITPSQAIVIGDGANDLAMMEIAGLSVAFRAKPIVAVNADATLNFVGLDGVLSLFI